MSPLNRSQSGGANAVASPTSSGAPAVQAAQEMMYRFASAGQDCRMLLWDVVISDDAPAAVPSFR